VRFEVLHAGSECWHKNGAKGKHSSLISKQKSIPVLIQEVFFGIFSFHFTPITSSPHTKHRIGAAAE